MAVAHYLIPEIKPVANCAYNTSGNVALSVTLPARVGAKTYLSGFYLSGGGATAASTINVAITGLEAGTLTYQVLVPAGAGNTNSSAVALDVKLPVDLPTSATNSAITLAVPSFGAGNGQASIVAYGFQLPPV